MVRKIISGGQTGVDQAALDVALALSIECGGWCPPGRACEGGTIPSQYPLTETPSETSPDAPDIPRSLRTEWNVRDADGTLILRSVSVRPDWGTDWTIQCADRYKRPYLIINPFDLIDASAEITAWLEEYKITILNVAGPCEGTCPGIGKSSYVLLLKTFRVSSHNRSL